MNSFFKEKCLLSRIMSPTLVCIQVYVRETGTERERERERKREKWSERERERESERERNWGHQRKCTDFSELEGVGGRQTDWKEERKWVCVCKRAHASLYISRHIRWEIFVYTCRHFMLDITPTPTHLYTHIPQHRNILTPPHPTHIDICFF